MQNFNDGSLPMEIVQEVFAEIVAEMPPLEVTPNVVADLDIQPGDFFMKVLDACYEKYGVAAGTLMLMRPLPLGAQPGIDEFTLLLSGQMLPWSAEVSGIPLAVRKGFIQPAPQPTPNYDLKEVLA